LNGEVEDDDGDLLSMSAGLGEARDAGTSQQPWTTVRFHMRKGEVDGRRRRAARERRKRGGGEAWHPGAASRGVVSASRAMLQIYPPYKNLVPRFVCSTREKRTRFTLIFNDLVDPTAIFFLEEVDP
jgi:hypothetical protein